MSSIKKENPISDEWKKLYAAQPEEVKRKLDALDNMDPQDYQLRMIKRKRPTIVDGDIFVLSPRENVYFFGKVLKANINHINSNSFVQGNHLVFIFKKKSEQPSIDEFRSDYSQLLIRPAIVSNSYWNSGLFFNIGNFPISDYERNLDYGFLKLGFKSNSYCKEDGTELQKRPEILGSFGISTVTGVAAEIEQELIINPDLLK